MWNSYRPFHLRKMIHGNDVLTDVLTLFEFHTYKNMVTIENH